MNDAMPEPYAPVSAADFRSRALAALAGPDAMAAGGGDHGDHRLNPGAFRTLDGVTLRDAAVLVPVVDYGDDARVIFTQRTSTLRKHSGQIAFPGGGIDDTDTSAEAAALREAEEEIGLDRSFVETLGCMPDYISGTGFRIRPVLSVVRPGFTLRPSPDEVEEIFEVPLSFLMQPANHRIGSRIWQGRERHFYEMPFGERYIWGITAGIVRAIYERLYE